MSGLHSMHHSIHSTCGTSLHQHGLAYICIHIRLHLLLTELQQEEVFGVTPDAKLTPVKTAADDRAAEGPAGAADVEAGERNSSSKVTERQGHLVSFWRCF